MYRHTRQHARRGSTLLTLAAEQDHTEAQYDLGYMHDKGLGGPVDKMEAILFRLAAARGISGAQEDLELLQNLV